MEPRVPSGRGTESAMHSVETSRYVRRVLRPDGVAVYHSLFGNLALLDPAGAELVEHFREAGTAFGAVQRFPHHEAVDVIQYMNLLVQRGFLVAAGHDEYSLIEEHRRRRLERAGAGHLVRALQLVLTNDCNFSCSHCFTKTLHGSEARAALECAPANQQMGIATARHSMDGLLRLAVQHGHTEVFVELFGGEPLMNWELIEPLLATYGNRTASGVAIRYSVTTNGSLLTPEMARTFAAFGVTVTVSVDGTAFGRLGVIGERSRQVLRNVAMLRDRATAVTLNSVMSGRNLGDFNGRGLVDVAVGLGVGMIGLILELDRGFYRVPANRERAFEILLDTTRYGRERRLPVVGYWQQMYQQIIGRQPLSLLSGYKTCPATGCKISVEPAGDVFACKCCSQRIGQITDLDAVFRTAAYQDYSARAYRAADACASCEIEGFCDGVCMGVLERQADRAAAPASTDDAGACGLYKRITRKLIEETDVREMLRLSLGDTGHGAARG